MYKTKSGIPVYPSKRDGYPIDRKAVAVVDYYLKDAKEGHLDDMTKDHMMIVNNAQKIEVQKFLIHIYGEDEDFVVTWIYGKTHKFGIFTTNWGTDGDIRRRGSITKVIPVGVYPGAKDLLKL